MDAVRRAILDLKASDLNIIPCNIESALVVIDTAVKQGALLRAVRIGH